MPFRVKEKRSLLAVMQSDWCHLTFTFICLVFSLSPSHLFLLILKCLLILSLPLRLAVVKTPALTCSVYLDLSTWFTSLFIDFSYPAAK